MAKHVQPCLQYPSPRVPQRLAESFAHHDVDGGALHGLHLIGFSEFRIQLGCMCPAMSLGSALKLSSRLAQLFKG